MCFEYSSANDLMFKPAKYVCIVFKPCRFKLYCPTVSIGTEPLTYGNTVKYLGFVYCEKKKDDEDMLTLSGPGYLMSLRLRGGGGAHVPPL